MTSRIFFFLLIFMANVSSAVTLESNNIEGVSFDECMTALTKGITIRRNLYYYKKRIFHIYLDGDSKTSDYTYICKERIFTGAKKVEVEDEEQEPEDFIALEFICRSDSPNRLQLPTCLDYKTSENSLSIKAKFPRGKKVRIKELKLISSKDIVDRVAIKFLPFKIPFVETLLIPRAGFECEIKDTDIEALKKASQLKSGVSYTVIGFVQWFEHEILSITNCSIENQTTSSGSGSIENQTSSSDSVSNDLVKMSDENICNIAVVSSNKGVKIWETSFHFKEYVDEAKRRGLSCGVGGT